MRQPAQIPGLKRTLQGDDSLNGGWERNHAAKDERSSRPKRRIGSGIPPRYWSGFRAYACIIHLQYGIDHEALRVAVVAAKSEHFANDSATRLALDMDNEIDGLSDLCFGVGKGRLRVAAHHEIGKATKGLFGRVRMDCGQRSGMAGVERIEQRSRLNSADFAEDDPVGTEAESGLQEVVEGDAGLEGIRLGFDRNNVRFLNMKLGGILDDDDPLVVGN